MSSPQIQAMVAAFAGPANDITFPALMGFYRQRIESRTRTDDDDIEASRRLDDIERQLRLAGLVAERDELSRLMNSRQIDSGTGKKLIREVDLQELRYL